MKNILRVFLIVWGFSIPAFSMEEDHYRQIFDRNLHRVTDELPGEFLFETPDPDSLSSNFVLSYLQQALYLTPEEELKTLTPELFSKIMKPLIDNKKVPGTPFDFESVFTLLSDTEDQRMPLYPAKSTYGRLRPEIGREDEGLKAGLPSVLCHWIRGQGYWKVTADSPSLKQGDPLREKYLNLLMEEARRKVENQFPKGMKNRLRAEGAEKLIEDHLKATQHDMQLVFPKKLTREVLTPEFTHKIACFIVSSLPGVFRITGEAHHAAKKSKARHSKKAQQEQEEQEAMDIFTQAGKKIAAYLDPFLGEKIAQGAVDELVKEIISLMKKLEKRKRFDADKPVNYAAFIQDNFKVSLVNIPLLIEKRRYPEGGEDTIRSVWFNEFKNYYNSLSEEDRALINRQPFYYRDQEEKPLTPQQEAIKDKIDRLTGITRKNLREGRVLTVFSELADMASEEKKGLGSNDPSAVASRALAAIRGTSLEQFKIQEHTIIPYDPNIYAGYKPARVARDIPAESHLYALYRKIETQVWGPEGWTWDKEKAVVDPETMIKSSKQERDNLRKSLNKDNTAYILGFYKDLESYAHRYGISSEWLSAMGKVLEDLPQQLGDKISYDSKQWQEYVEHCATQLKALRPSFDIRREEKPIDTAEPEHFDIKTMATALSKMPSEKTGGLNLDKLFIEALYYMQKFNTDPRDVVDFTRRINGYQIEQPDAAETITAIISANVEGIVDSFLWRY